MIRPFFMMVFAAGLLAACQPEDKPGKCQTGAPNDYTAPYDMEFCPGDIQAWMDRANSCAHFMGEEAYDEERAEFLNTQMTEQMCTALGCDYQALFQKYEGDVVYTGVLVGYTETLFGAVDNLPVCPQAEKVNP